MEGGGGMMAPGFRFYPTEEELVAFYLKHKIQNSGTTRLLQEIDRVIPQFHIYDFYPWDLPQYAGEQCRGDPEQWFFFVPRQENEARGGRISRLTSSGYWKATGSPSVVYSSSNRGIGIKRTMVFYNGRAPTGKKTKWKMNEYKAFEEQPSSNTNPTPELMQELSLCRIYIKSNSLRAFDRRPSGVVIHESATPHQIHHNNNVLHATTSTHNSTPYSSMIERTYDDHSYINTSEDQQNTTNSSSLMEVMDQPMWDWEEHHNYL